MQQTEKRIPTSVARATGVMAILATLSMVTGAALWASSGADLDAALAQRTVGDYLVQAAEVRVTLLANLALWMIGASLMSAAVIGFFSMTTSRSLVAHLALGGAVAGVALALASFSIWMGIVLEVAPAHAAGADLSVLGAALGQAASISDWVATALILAAGGGLIGVAGRRDWAPNWLYGWSLLLILVGAVSLFGLFIDARTSLSFLIVPVGLLWFLAAGVTALRVSTRQA